MEKKLFFSSFKTRGIKLRRTFQERCLGKLFWTPVTRFIERGPGKSEQVRRWSNRPREPNGAGPVQKSWPAAGSPWVALPVEQDQQVAKGTFHEHKCPCPTTVEEGRVAGTFRGIWACWTIDAFTRLWGKHEVSKHLCLHVTTDNGHNTARSEHPPDWLYMCTSYISLYDTLETVTKTQESTILKSYSECFETQERRYFLFNHFVASEERLRWSRKNRETGTEKVTSSSGSLADNLWRRHITPWFSKVCKGALLPDLATALDWPHACASQRASGAQPLAGRQQDKGPCVFCSLIQTHLCWLLQHSNDYLRLETNIG